MKINTELELSETETLFDILEQKIIESGPQAKLAFLAKEITESQYKWHQGHCEYLKGIKAKLLAQPKEDKKLDYVPMQLTMQSAKDLSIATKMVMDALDDGRLRYGKGNYGARWHERLKIIRSKLLLYFGDNHKAYENCE